MNNSREPTKCKRLKEIKSINIYLKYNLLELKINH